MTDPNDPLIDGLLPLTQRVRTDVTAVKRDGKQAWTQQELTRDRLARHLNSGPARGVCPIKEGESSTRVALLDFDSHKGEVDWAAMSKAVSSVADVLEMGWSMHPVLFRSSGGNGVHLYLLWDEPQDCYSVREFLRGVLEGVGLKSGAGGLVKSEVEVFPKQNEVKAGGYGNQFVLPLAGASVPLELWEGDTLW